MTRKDLINKVLVQLEEISPFDEPESFLVEDANVKPIRAYIEDIIDESCDEMLKILPRYMVNDNVIDITNDVDIQVSSDKVGYCEKPIDYLCLHTVKLADWERVVNGAISSISPSYNLQRNKYTRGKSSKPVIAVNDDKLELYSCVVDPIVEVFKYIPMTSTTRCFDESGEEIDDPTYIEDSIAPFCAKNCAIKILKIFSEENKAKSLLDELQKELQTSIS